MNPSKHYSFDVDFANKAIKLDVYTNQMSEIAKNFNKPELSDLILTVNNSSRKFYVNKFFLVSFSEYFKAMLSETWTHNNQKNGDDPSQLPTRNIPIDSDLEDVFEKFLKFFYTGDLDMTNNDELIKLYRLADMFNVPSLLELVQNLIAIKCSSPNLRDALEFYKLSIELNMAQVTQECWKTIIHNIEVLIYWDEWFQFDVKFVKLLLLETDLVINDELTLFDAVCRWLLDDRFDPDRLKNFESNCRELLPCIRFCFLYNTQLFLVEHSKFMRQAPPTVKQLIRDGLNKAYRFRCIETMVYKFYNKYTPRVKRIGNMNNMNSIDGHVAYFRKYHPNETKPNNVNLLHYVDFMTQLKTLPKREKLEYVPNLEHIPVDLNKMENFTRYSFDKSRFSHRIKSNLYSFIVLNKKNSEIMVKSLNESGNGDDLSQELDDTIIRQFNLATREVNFKSLSSQQQQPQPKQQEPNETDKTQQKEVNNTESKIVDTTGAFISNDDENDGFRIGENLDEDEILETFDEWYIPRNYTEICAGDKAEIKNKLKVNITYDAKLYAGIVPKTERVGDWKIVYKTFGSSTNLNFWTVRIICGQNAFIDDSIRARVTLVCLDNEDRILQVVQRPTFLFDCNSHFEFPIEFKSPETCKHLYVLIRRCLF